MKREMKTCKTCKTCKHWGHSRNYAEDNGSRLKSCSAPKIAYGYGVESDVADNGALVEDDEGWGMLTGPEFGCVLHEKK